MKEAFIAPPMDILVVDDNRINRKVIESLLKTLKMKIDTAESGRDAIAKVKDKKYDFVLMDYMMSEMDGKETLRHIRELDVPYSATIPVIALTASEEEGIGGQLIAQGFDDFLRKPIDLQEICDIIKRWLPKDFSDETEKQLDAKADETILPEIEGLDVEQGIAQAGGDELYREILGDFYIMIEPKAKEIETFLAERMFHEYTIEVHALKTTARLIGAMELSERCYRLEQLGKAEQEEALVEETPAMLALYRRYITILRPYGEREMGCKEISTAQLILLLERLYSAMDSFNLDEVDDIMRELERYQMPVNCREHMEVLRVYVADVAIQDIMDTASQMIEILKTD